MHGAAPCILSGVFHRHGVPKFEEIGMADATLTVSLARTRLKPLQHGQV
jgi:hypothetical protein